MVDKDNSFLEDSDTCIWKISRADSYVKGNLKLLQNFVDEKKTEDNIHYKYFSQKRK